MCGKGLVEDTRRREVKRKGCRDAETRHTVEFELFFFFSFQRRSRAFNLSRGNRTTGRYGTREERDGKMKDGSPY